MAFDSNAYKADFNRENYDRLNLMLPKGKKALLKEYANKHGESINKVVTTALEVYTGLDLSKE